MRYLLLLLVVLALPAQARTITDSAGRVVEIPDEVNTVFAAGPPASILVYIMKPEALTGWPRATASGTQLYCRALSRHSRNRAYHRARR